MASWSFLTSHARVLLVIATNPEIRLRDMADSVGISERRAHGIVSDLATGGYLTKVREGRRNRYEVLQHRPLAHDLTEHLTIGDMLALLVQTTNAEGSDPEDREQATRVTGITGP